MSNTVHSLDCRYILSLSRCFLRFVRLSWPTLHYQILHQALSVSNFLKIVDTPVTVFSSPLPRHTVIWTSCRTDTDFLSQVPKYGLNLLNMNHYSALVLVNIMIYCRYIPKESLLVDIHFIHINIIFLWMQPHHFSVFPGDNKDSIFFSHHSNSPMVVSLFEITENSIRYLLCLLYF